MQGPPRAPAPAPALEAGAEEPRPAQEPQPAADEPAAVVLPPGFVRTKWLVLIGVALLVLVLDQASKHWAQQTLRNTHQGRLVLVDDYLAFNYVRNPGAAWGFLARSRESFRQPFFLIVSVAALLFIFYIHWRLEPGQRMLLLAVSLVMGGALGNLIDRVRLRYVIDFIEAHWQHRYRWPTFNVADIAITVGVLLLLLEMLLGPRWRARQARRQQVGP